MAASLLICPSPSSPANDVLLFPIDMMGDRIVDFTGNGRIRPIEVVFRWGNQGDRRQICPIPDALIDGSTGRKVISVRIEAGGFAGEVYGAMTNHIWR